MRLTAAQTDDGHGHGDGDANGHGNDAAPSAGSGGSEDRGDNSALAISALVAGLPGLLAGGVALARPRKCTRPFTGRGRSEERRVGEGWVQRVNFRWWAYH